VLGVELLHRVRGLAADPPKAGVAAAAGEQAAVLAVDLQKIEGDKWGSSQNLPQTVR